MIRIFSLTFAITLTLILGVSFMAKKAKAAESPLENTLYVDFKDSCRVTIEMRPDLAPKTVKRIKELVRKGFYDGTPFHRVIDGFMAQGGDPTGTGMGGSGQKLPDEFPRPSPNAYTRGVTAMANAGLGTSDSQFFIMLSDYPLPPNYTVWGKVSKGMECVDKIKKGDQNDNGHVENPDKIMKAQVAADVK